VEVTRAASRGKVTAEDLENAYATELSTFIELQKQAGLDYVVDGQLNWKDLFRPFSNILVGIHAGGLSRWFDNNTFYRKPIITQRVVYRGVSLEEHFKFGKLPANLPRKVILPGPYTFATLSNSEFYSSIGDLVDDIAHSLRDLVRDLKKVGGYECFQFNEPCICFKGLPKDDPPRVAQAYDTLVKGIGARTILHTYFGDVAPALETILDTPVDYVGVDLYATSADSLKQHKFEKGLVCGCIDARNSLLESSDPLTRIVTQINDQVSPKSVSIAPNCDLDFLPQSIARKKLALLSDVRREVK
jgi:5-methyltetrahydropteroyltriglutamate--homocysteine methyltransferase